MAIKVYSRTCIRGRDIIVPLFETPFFAHGCSNNSVTANSRFTCVYVGPQDGSVAGFYYRPDVTVLNVTPNVIPVQTARFGPGDVSCIGEFVGQIAKPGGLSQRWTQIVPFGANGLNPLLSQAQTNTVIDPVRTNTMELNAAAGFLGNGLFCSVAMDEGILSGNGFYCFNPNFKPDEHFIANGPQYSGVGEDARYMTMDNCIPNYADDNNYFYCGGLPIGGPQNNIVRWGNKPNGDIDGTRWITTFDDASIDTQLVNGPPTTAKVTRAGWLLTNLAPVTAFQSFDVILISRDGSTWRRIIFAPQTPRAATAITNVSLNQSYAAHIDNSGIFYLFDYTDDGRLYTSFGLDIPLLAPLLPANQIPNLPCMPLCFPLGLDVPAL